MSHDVEEERPAWDSGGPRVRATLEKLGRGGLDPQLAGEIVTSVARIAADALDQARPVRPGDDAGRSGIIQAMRTVVGLAGQLVRGARDRHHLPIASTACSAGCAHCCKLHVSISPPEAIVLAAFLRDTVKPIEPLVRRIEAMAREVAAMDHDARMAANRDCPLLSDGRCIAYPVRPLACAAANSFDADACARGGEIPVEPNQLYAIHATQIGLSVASRARGLDFDRYELCNALAIALRTSDAAERWLRGERIFQRTPGDPEIGETIDAFVARDPALTRRRSPQRA